MIRNLKTNKKLELNKFKNNFRFSSISKLALSTLIAISIFTQNINASIFCSEQRKKEIEKQRKIKAIKNTCKKCAIYGSYTAIAIFLLSGLGLAAYNDLQDDSGKNNQQPPKPKSSPQELLELNNNFIDDPLVQQNYISFCTQNIQNQIIPDVNNPGTTLKYDDKKTNPLNYLKTDDKGNKFFTI